MRTPPPRPRVRNSLRLRLSLILTGLAAAMIVVGAIGWFRDTRQAIGEEVETASRVASQWLSVAARNTAMDDPLWTPEFLLAHIAAVGRLRANELIVVDDKGMMRYRSPAPTYKAGREAPAWFAELVAPPPADIVIPAGSLKLILHPDSSRAVLDAWDDLKIIAASATFALLAIFTFCWLALQHALRPLGPVMEALARLGNGHFDTRLPVFRDSELGLLAEAFNGMADRLDAAVRENLHLYREQELAEAVQARMEAERQLIARELHDEMAQGITAVRAIAGAIAQRAADRPEICRHAQSIIDVSGEVQHGVRGIVRRLRETPGEGSREALAGWLQTWRSHHAEIDLVIDIAAFPESAKALAQPVLRIVQEGLTNVVRHARAKNALVRVRCEEGMLCVDIEDDGCGTGAANPTTRGSGFGLLGMRERAEALGGQASIEDRREGGTRVSVCLPLANTVETSK